LARIARFLSIFLGFVPFCLFGVLLGKKGKEVIRYNIIKGKKKTVTWEGVGFS